MFGNLSHKASWHVHACIPPLGNKSPTSKQPNYRSLEALHINKGITYIKSGCISPFMEFNVSVEVQVKENEKQMKEGHHRIRNKKRKEMMMVFWDTLF